MSHILTLVTDQNDFPYDEIEAFLAIAPQWQVLDSNKAIETPIALSSIKNLQALCKVCDDAKVDVFVTPEKNRRKKLLLADMDSTIVQGETLDDLAAYAGIKDQIAAITARAMNGELDFHTAIRERVGLLKGLSAEMLHKTLQETYLNKGAKTLVQTMKKNDAVCVLISGGFTFFTEAIARQTGFHHHHGNHLNIDDQVLAGTVGEPILDKDSKRDYLHNYVADLALDLFDVLTIGDGANDLPMLLAAQNADGLGMGYYAKPAVAQQLTNVIRHTDLTAALYAQGYKREELMLE